MTDAQARLKQQAAANAVELVSGGMVIGLGTGSTTNFAIDMLGQKVQSGQLTGITGVPTSEATAGRAKAVGIPLGELADFSALDLAIDGADEVDPALNLTKGWGGALVREKLVESCAERLVIIVDESKMVPRLGTRGPLPVEVVPFAWQVQARRLQTTLSCRVSLRRNKDGSPYVTDNRNYILHCAFNNGIPDPYAVQRALAGYTGVVGHGLFLDMATDVLVAAPSTVKHLRRT